VLSGNRNFEGRINPDVKMNYLASPPLVVAYALAGTMDIDLLDEPLGQDADGKPVYLRDIWPTPQEVAARSIEAAVVASRCSASDYATSSRATSAGGLEVPEGRPLSPGTRSRPTCASRRTSRACRRAGPVDRHRGRARARAARRLGHHRPHLAGRLDQGRTPGRPYLIEHGVERADFNSYGSRRGNHEVMMRGTFANIRLRNQLAPGTEGGVTRTAPTDGEEMTIYDAAMRTPRRGAAVVLGRQGVRLGLVARLGGQGHRTCSASGGDRRELRAHPPLEPDRHGRAAAAVPDGPAEVAYMRAGGVLNLVVTQMLGADPHERRARPSAGPAGGRTSRGGPQ
jgi:aconitate hydratase